MSLDHNKLSRKFPRVYAELIKHPSMNIEVAADSVLYHYGVSVQVETFRRKYKYYVEIGQGAKLRIQPFLSKRGYTFPEEAKEKGTLAVFEIIENQLPFI